MTDANAVTLYDFPFSIACQMVRIAFAEKGIAYRKRMVDITKAGENFEPWYVELNPNAVVPTLDVDGEIHCEMQNIMRKADAQFDGPALTPAAAEDEAEMERWMKEASDISYASLLYALKMAPDGTCPPLLGRARMIQKVRESHPQLEAQMAERMENNIEIRERLSSSDGLARLRDEVHATVQRLEKALEGRTFIVGEQYTIADAMWTATLARLKMHGLDAWWTGGKLPNVEAYYGRVEARPSWSSAKVFDVIPPGFLAPPSPQARPPARAAAPA